MSHELLVQIIIYLAAALLTVPVAKRLGLGSVLGYLFAGILIGPFVLNLSGEGQDVMHAAEFGVVMMLFMIGMELEPKKLWDLRVSVLGLGGLQILLTSLFIGGLVYFFLADTFQQSIVVGLTLALSSTAIVLQSLREKNQTKGPLGTKSFAVLLFQDMAVIPILALFPLLAPDTGQAKEGSALLAVLAPLGGIGFTVLVGLFLVNPFFRLLAKTQLRELFMIAVLFLIVGVSYLMESVGLSPALGAFIAGVLLAKSEFRHELETAINPFKSLMMGIFFIAVGATMDFSILIKYATTVIACVLGLVAIKAFVLYAVSLIFQFPRPLQYSFSLTLAQAGEFAFVLSSFALSLGILNQELFGLINIVTALSMLCTPLLMLVDEKFIQPSLQKESENSANHDEEIKEQAEENEVVIAGFGRFGQVVGRFLRYNGINSTILDLDPRQIEILGKIGFKVFYGDANRLDLLHASHIENAKVLVVAVGNPNISNEIVDLAQHHFPHLQILVRAVNHVHAYHLTKKKVDFFRLETFSSALEVGTQALVKLGYSPYQAYKNAQLFEHHDTSHIKEMADHWEDKENYFVRQKKISETLEELLNMDSREESHLSADQFWKSEDPANQK